MAGDEFGIGIGLEQLADSFKPKGEVERWREHIRRGGTPPFVSTPAWEEAVRTTDRNPYRPLIDALGGVADITTAVRNKKQPQGAAISNALLNLLLSGGSGGSLGKIPDLLDLFRK